MQDLKSLKDNVAVILLDKIPLFQDAENYGIHIFLFSF